MVSTETKLLFVDPDDKDFKDIFKPFPDPVLRNDKYHECLQYVGTVLKAGKVFNQFRHRALPGSDLRKYWEFEASESLTTRVLAGEFNLF